jgi:RNA polymerase sigma factor (sigma-70 family)
MSYARDADDALLLARGEYGRLLAIYDPFILQRCVAALRGSLDAEDVAQDVKLRLYRELKAGKQYPLPFRLVVHKVIDWTLKEYFRGRPTDLPLPDGWEMAVEDDPLGDLVVEEVLDGLPSRARQVCHMRLVEGLRPEEIAAALGITRNAVDQALHRGYLKLRERLLHG